MKRMFALLLMACTTGLAQAAVTAHFAADCRDGVRFVSAGGVDLVYDATWYDEGKRVSVTDNGRSVVSGDFGTCHWTPGDENLHLLQMTVTDASGVQVANEVVGCMSTIPSDGAVSIPDGWTDIPANLFRNCDWLTAVTIPSSVTNIAPTAFAGCTNVSLAVLPPVDGLSTVFPDSYRTLTTVTVSGGTSLPAYFAAGCTNLATVTLPETLTEVGVSAFSGCDGLTRVNVSSLASWLGVFFANAEANPLHAGASLYVGGRQLTDLVIPEGTAEIGPYAFAGLADLISVTIPSSVTNIGANAFSCCESLSRVNVPNMAGWLAIRLENAEANPLHTGASLYVGGRQLTELVIPEGTAEIGPYAFAGLADLISVTIPSSVTNIAVTAFSACTNVVEISCGLFPKRTIADVFPDFYAHLERIGINAGNSGVPFHFFAGCTAVREVEVIAPTQTLADIFPDSFAQLERVVVRAPTERLPDRFFAGCSALERIAFPETLKDIGDNDLRWYAAQSETRGLVIHDGWVLDYKGTAPQLLTIPEGVRGVAPWALCEQYEVTEVILPSTLKAIGIGAFAGDTILARVVIPDAVERIGDRAFKGCTCLAEVEFGSGLESIGSEAFAGCAKIKDFALPGTVAFIGENAFCDATGFTEIVVPMQLRPLQQLLPKSYGTITKVTIPEGSTSVCDSAFVGCGALTHVTLASSVTNIGNSAFKNCTSLVRVDEGTAELQTIGAEAFFNCSRLASVSLPQTLRDIGVSAFQQCAVLLEVYIPGGVTNIGISAFNACSSLRRISLPFALERLGGSALANCPLETVTLPDGVRILSANLFYGCQQLASVGLPEGLERFETEPFNHCASLPSLVVPSTVTSLVNYAFSPQWNYSWNQNGIASVYFLGNAPTYTDQSYANTPDSFVTYVMNGSKGWDGIAASYALPDSWPKSNGRAIRQTVLNRFEVTFDANGGAFDNGDGELPTSRAVVESEGLPFAFPCDWPVRDGFRFEGWWTAPSEGELVSARTLVTADSPRTLYARWLYRTQLDPAGGTLSSGADVFRTGDEAYELPEPARDSRYVFLGWFAGDVRVRTVADLMTAGGYATAQWRERTYYTVAFNANGGTGSMSAQSFEHGVSQALASNAFRRNNYTFLGWALSAGGEVAYLDGETVSDVTLESGATVTLYAVWRPPMTLSGTTVTVSATTETTLATAFPDDFARVTDVVIADGVTGVAPGFFAGCTRLVRVTMPDRLRLTLGFDDLWPSAQAAATYDANGFLIWDGWVWDYQDKTVWELEVPEGIVGLGKEALCDFWDMDTLILPSTLRYIGDGALARNYMLDHVVLPESVEWLGCGAFEDCTYLTDLTFGRSLRVIGARAFAGCESLGLALRFGDGVEEIGDEAFLGCAYLQSVALPMSVKRVSPTAFKGCTGLRGLTVPTSIASLSTWFAASYAKIETVTVPSGETEVCPDMFRGCSSLTSVALPEGVTNLSEGAFWDCTRLTVVSLPSTLRSIGANAFRNCDALMAIGLPDAVEELGAYAFYDCYRLKDVTLSKNLGNLPERVFESCPALDSLYVPAAVTNLGSRVFGSGLMSVYFFGDAPVYANDAYASTSSGLTTYVRWSENVRERPKGWDGRAGSRSLPSSGRWPVNNTWSRPITTWSSVPFDVTFDAGEGVFAPVAASTYACEQIRYTAYSLPPFNPTRKGWKFAGWWTEAVGGAEVTPSTGVKLDKAHTLYAHWTKGIVVTVRFNACGGTVSPDELEYTAEMPFETFPVPTREHYIFTGWYTMPSGGTEMRVSTEVPMADRELFAHWTPAHYGIRFNANNGTGAVAWQDFIYGETVTLRKNTFSCRDCQFVGWALTPGGEVAYTDRKTIQQLAAIEDGVIDLYAVWTGSVYAVRFDSHGGTGRMANQTFVIGVSQALAPCAYERDGFVFAGWARSTTGEVAYGDQEVVSDLTRRANDAVVLYAVWKSDPSAAWTVNEYLNCTNLTFALGGDEPHWFGLKTARAGTAGMMRSGAIGDSRTNWIETVVGGPGTIRFWWKASGEFEVSKKGSITRYDYAEFTVDGEAVAEIGDESDWTEVVYEVTGAGSHTIRWMYHKDESGSDGEDCVWLSEVGWTPTAEVDPIPELGPEAGAAAVRSALEGSADARLQESITDVATYSAYRTWAHKIGAAEVKASPNAWASFAVDSAGLLEKILTDEDLRIEAFAPSSTVGSFDFTVSVKDVVIGRNASEDNLKKLFGLEGAESLDPVAFSADKVTLDFMASEDGKLKFKATLSDKRANSFFMKMKVR